MGTATSRLLEGCVSSDVERVVLASSGSVYGRVPTEHASESSLPRPQSPYGVTKLAAERLAVAYADAFGLPVVPLRLFYVYGPRQRPDVGLYRMIESALTGRTFELFGSPCQGRDMVYAEDVVDAMILAGGASVDAFGEPINIASAQTVRLSTLLDLVFELSGHPVVVVGGESRPGYVHSTRGTNELAAARLGWSPTTSLKDGLAKQIAWQAEALVTTVNRRSRG
jgi:nucleoside-diphosphate-sugar epimerase